MSSYVDTSIIERRRLNSKHFVIFLQLVCLCHAGHADIAQVVNTLLEFVLGVNFLFVKLACFRLYKREIRKKV